ncbi:MAG: AbrB/MazE/SpoVT family DNA-binding domain-containing protein [Candidatus Brocadiales bacterium]|nr:AbrB/MazE/SpoVT family DNA-binding domain-containing protein [Candidatus Brocadiales bacterium]
MKTATISYKGQVARPKEIRDALHIKAGDQVTFKVDKGKIVLEQMLSVPRSQAGFWTPDVQEKIKKADKNFKSYNFKTYEIDRFVKELKD